jgi:hypothetical protein
MMSYESQIRTEEGTQVGPFGVSPLTVMRIIDPQHFRHLPSHIIRSIPLLHLHHGVAGEAGHPELDPAR